MNKIIEIKFGSHLYGTNTSDSDTDIKGIYLPTAREIVLGSYKQTIVTKRNKGHCERNTKDDVDTEFFSLDRFLELLVEGQTVALDVLFSPEFQSTHIRSNGTNVRDFSLWPIFENREKLLTRNVNAFVGYARQQAAKYGIKGSRMDALKRTRSYLNVIDDKNKKLEYYDIHITNLIDDCNQLVSLEKTPLVEVVMLKGPKGLIDAPHLKVNGRAIPLHATVKYASEVVDKMLEGYGQRAHKAHLAGGVDWKALSHAVRVNGEALELLGTGSITFPRPDRELLIKIKLGQLPYEQVAELIEQGLADLCKAHEVSTLREVADQEWVDNFVYETYSKVVKDEK